MLSSKDCLYANPIGEIPAFKFDEAVVNVFPDMIRRSVPGYSTIISAIGMLAARYAQAGSRCYDLGCSLGAVSLAMSDQVAVEGCRIVAVDNSPAMVERLKLSLGIPQANIDVVCADIRDVEIANASIVVLNFTLQFIPLADRQALLSRVYQGMLPGGLLILSEKLACEDERQQQLQIDMHHEFKRQQGYSDLEISQKRTALENVLLPESFSTHRQRLVEAGFASVEVWFRYFNFASMIALR